MPEKTLASGKKIERNINQRLQQEVQAEILEVLENNPGLRLPQIAQFLGAENFLVKTESKKKGGQPGLRFNITGYIKERVKQGKLETIRLPQHVEQINEVIIPPDEKEIIVGSGAGWEEPKFIPRTEYLMELITEMGWDYDVAIGKNTPEMMRGESYQVFIMLDLNKIVFINNEEGNATFIVHHLEPDESWENYSDLTKEQLREFEGSGLVTRTIFRGEVDEWKNKIENLLLKTFKTESSSEHPEIPDSEKPPEDWITNFQLAKLVGMDHGVIRNKALKYKKNHPEWMMTYRKKYYYSPELVLAIKKEISNFEDAPQGWLTRQALADKLGVSDYIIKTRTNHFRKSHPDWFKIYLTSIKTPIEHFSPELIKIIEEEIKNISNPPESWLTANALSKKLNNNPYKIRKIIESLRAQYPDEFGVFIFRGRAVIYFSPIISSLVENEINEIKNIPPGWEARTQVARRLEIDVNYLSKIAQQFINKNPDWQKTYKPKTGIEQPFYSTELVTEIEKIMGSIEVAPEGWLTILGISKALGSSHKTVSRIVDKYRKTNPKWFKNYKEDKGPFREFLDPELIQIINDEIVALKTEEGEIIPFAPEGWMTNKQAAKLLDIDEQTLKRYARDLLKENPDWQKKYLNTNHKINNFYSPKLIEKIKEILAAIKPAPEGWMTRKQVSSYIGIDPATVKKMADIYLKKHPDWIGEFTEKGKKVLAYYSPQLINELIKEIDSRKKAPPGWKTAGALATELDISPTTAKRLAYKHQADHPEWFKEYLDSVNKLVIFYAPELCQLIRDKKKKYEAAPEGWMTITNLREELKSAPPTIKKIAAKWVDQYPDSIQTFQDKMGRPNTFYSSELIAQIKKDLEK